MRAKQKEVTDFSEICEIIAKCDTIRVAMFDGDYPYIVPLNFGEEVEDGKVVFYLHAAKEGKKLDLLRKNPHVAFEMDCGHELYYRTGNMSCNFRYESVMGTGRVEFLPETESAKALTVLMNHYHADPVPFNPKFVPITLCMKLTVEMLTAKRAKPRSTTGDYNVMPFKGDMVSPHEE